MALLVLRRVGLCVGQNQMCHLCDGYKIELKKCAVGKIKNTERSARSVGLKVVRLLYGLYVFGHLSKWFTFLFLVLVSLSGCVVRYTCSQLVYTRYKVAPIHPNMDRYALLCSVFLQIYYFSQSVGENMNRYIKKSKSESNFRHSSDTLCCFYLSAQWIKCRIIYFAMVGCPTSRLHKFFPSGIIINFTK